MKVEIIVTLKNGVLDPQGKAIQQTLNGMNFSEAKDVRQGKYFNIEMGIDDNMNGTLDSSEVDKTEYVCNGEPGTAGTDNRIKYTHLCSALLENTSFYYRYRVRQFVNEDIYIQGEIYGASYEVADSVMYSKLQNGWETAPLYINYDVAGSANFGYFKITLNRSTMVTTIVYTDSDVSGGSDTWSQPSSDCTTQTLF